jgi:transposase
VFPSREAALISEEELMDVKALRRQGLSCAEIGRLLGRDWRTVKRYLEDGAQPAYRRRRAGSKLDRFKPLIDQWLAGEPRLLATRIHQDLVRDYGFQGGYDTVRRYVERARPRRDPKLEQRFETAPGHQAQVDRSYEQPIATSSGLQLALFCFHMVLGRSRDYRPKTKGKVESDVPYVRERLLRAHSFASYEQANEAWESWNEDVARKRVHGAHGEVVALRAKRDRDALAALPGAPYLVIDPSTRIVARDGLFSFQGRRYAVPDARPGERVELLLGAEELEVYRVADGRRLGRHRRGAPAQVLADPEEGSVSLAAVLGALPDPEVHARPLASYEQALHG